MTIADLTGQRIIPDSETTDIWAVSLTQWGSMGAHEDFLKSPASGPFFESLKVLTRGPPVINHYYLGPTDQFAETGVAEFEIGSMEQLYVVGIEGDKPSVVSVVGRCLEAPDKVCRVTFATDGFKPEKLGEIRSQSGKKADAYFTVDWRSFEKSSARLHL